MFGSSESWGPQQHPHPWHFRAGGGAVHSIKSGCEQAQHAGAYSITSSARASSIGGTSRPTLHFARDQKVFHRPPDWVDLVVVVVGWWRTIISPRRNVVWRGRSIVGRWIIVSRGRNVVSRGRNVVSRGRSVEPRAWCAAKAVA